MGSGAHLRYLNPPRWRLQIPSSVKPLFRCRLKAGINILAVQPTTMTQLITNHMPITNIMPITNNMPWRLMTQLITNIMPITNHMAITNHMCQVRMVCYPCKQTSRVASQVPHREVSS